MLETPATDLPVKAILILVILVAVIFSSVREGISPDLTALLAVLAPLLTDIPTPVEAFAGLAALQRFQ